MQAQSTPQSSSMNPNAPGGGGGPGAGTLGTSPLHSHSPVSYQQQQQQQQQSMFVLGPQSSPHHLGQQQVASGQHQQVHQTQQQHHQQHAHSPLLVGGGGVSMMSSPSLDEVFALSEHTDDDNDVFQCGKCKSTFCQLQQFVSHKKHCHSALSLGQPKMGSPHQSSLSSSVMSSHQHHSAHQHHHVQHQLTTNLDLDLGHLMMADQSTGPLSSGPMLAQDSTPTHHHHHQHHGHGHHQPHHHHRQPSPTLTEAIGGHSSVNSILSETDLLSLTPSLDAQMMVSIGNSISPTSLLHLQGGDVSANTDDFAQFRLTPTPTQSPQPSGQLSGGHVDASLGYHDIPPNVELHQGHSMSHRNPQSPQSPQSLVNSLMNSLQNSSPTSFASLIQGLSTGGGDVGGPVSVQSASSTSNSLLPTVEVDTHSNDNSNSIGSPSRFLNLPPPRTPSGSQSSQSTVLSSAGVGSDPSTPLRPSSLPSIVEHHPQHQQQQQQPQSQAAAAASLTVIHHHPSHLSPRRAPSNQGPNAVSIKEEPKDDYEQKPRPLASLPSGSSQIVPPNVTIKKEFEKPPLVCISTHSATSSTKANPKVTLAKSSSQPKQQVLSNVNCFPCNYCDRSFPKNTDLLNHMPCHTGEKPFQCLHCGKAFSQKSNLRKHIQTHKISRDEMRVIYKNSLEAMAQTKTISPSAKAASTGGTGTGHLVKKEPAKSTNGFHGSTSQKSAAAATAATEQTTTTAQLDSASSDLGIGSQDSQSPVKSLQQQQQSQPKKQQQQQQQQVSCPLEGCPFWSEQEGQLRAHFTAVHVTVPVGEDGSPLSNLAFKCVKEGCETLLFDLDAFLGHLMAHSGQTSEAEAKAKASNENEKPKAGKQRSYRCPTCLARYTTEEALRQHQTTSTHHFPCDKCDKVFPCERYLRRHMMTHGAVLYSCKYCEKSFKTANYLKVHLVIHTGEKPFTCSICDAAFNRRDKLKRHELVHDPVKRYKCPLNVNGCTREFNRPDKLKAHILTHSGVKPYQCSQCQRSFTRRAHLREHFKSHGDETAAALPGHDANASTSEEKEKDSTAEGKQQPAKVTSSLSASETLSALAKSSGSGTLKRARTISSSDEINPTTEEEEDDSSDASSSDDIVFVATVKDPKAAPVTTGAPPVQSKPTTAVSAPPITSNFILVSSNPSNASQSQQQQQQQQQATTPSSGNANQPGTVVMGMEQLNFLTSGNFVLVFPCPRCDQCFLKEPELKAHQAKCSSTSRNNNPSLGQVPGNIMLMQQPPQTRPLDPST